MIITRPSEHKGVKLFYNRGRYKANTNVNFRNPINMVIATRLYRMSSFDNFPMHVNKDWFVETYFADLPATSPSKVARMLNMALLYECGYRKRVPRKYGGGWTYGYRFWNRFDVHYGMERIICSWLPSYVHHSSGGVASILSRDDLKDQLSMLLESDAENDIIMFIHNRIDSPDFCDHSNGVNSLLLKQIRDYACEVSKDDPEVMTQQPVEWHNMKRSKARFPLPDKL